MFNISLAIILDELKEYPFTNYADQKANPNFKSFSLIPDYSSDFDRDVVYIGLLSKALLVERPDDVIIICVRDRISDETESEEKLHNLIIINKTIDFRALQSIVNNTFNKIGNWIISMQDALIHEKNESELLVLCEPVIGNYISISDSAMMFIANTPNIYIDCPVALSLIKNGYHPAETVNYFQKLNLYKSWSDSEVIQVCPSDPILSKYETLSYVFKYKNNYFQHIVMSCNNKAPSQGLVDLFNILISFLGIIIQRKGDIQLHNSHPYDELLREVLSGSDISEEEFYQRAAAIGVDVKNAFYLLLIRADFSNIVMMDRLGRELPSVFFKSRLLKYKKDLVVLVSQNEQSEAAFKSEKFAEIINRYEARCAISMPTESVINIKSSYDQVCKLLAVNISPENVIDIDYYTPIEEQSIINFNDHPFAYLLLESDNSRNYWLGCPYHDMLKKLYDYDASHKTSCLSLLYHYIANEGKATATSEILHMHRNNVMHHINRIEELLDISLSLPIVRINLSYAYTMLQLFGL